MKRLQQLPVAARWDARPSIISGAVRRSQEKSSGTRRPVSTQARPPWRSCSFWELPHGTSFRDISRSTGSQAADSGILGVEANTAGMLSLATIAISELQDGGSCFTPVTMRTSSITTPRTADNVTKGDRR